MRVSDLTRAKPLDVTIDLGDGDMIVVRFDRNKVTPAWVGLAQQRDEASDALSLPKALADVILDWDVVADNDEPFPPTVENLAVFSYPAQSDLLRRILEEAVPSRAEGNASANTSSSPSMDSTDAPASPQNGQVVSLSPPPSASPSLT